MSEAHEIQPDETQDRDYEAEARQLGWHPLSEFNGDPKDFVDARAFVIRGESRLPILQENNRKLSQRVRRTDDELAETRTKLAEMDVSLKALRTMAEKSNEAGYQRALADLKAQQRQAVADGDVPRFEKIETEIAAVEATREEIVPKPDLVPPPNKGPKGSPEFLAWLAENNDWVQADPILGKYAVDAELSLRQGDDDLTEGEIWDQVTETVKEKYPRRFAKATGGQAPAQHEPGEAPSRRAAPVLVPRGGSPANQVRKGGIASIQDPEERKIAQAAFNSIRRGIPDYTEAEYMKAYTQPNYDPIPDATARRLKANGSARPN